MRGLNRESLRWMAVISAFVVVAVAVGGYLLSQQRLRLPFSDRYRIDVAFTAADALAPDTGQPVSVAGVPVGEVTGVRLRSGRAIVTLSIDPKRLPRVHADARATLLPITPLKNMEVALEPGSRSAPALRPGATIDASRTSTTLDVDQILAALDVDSRAALQQLIGAAERGLDGRGDALGEALADLGPTAGQLRRITGALGDRDRTVRELVHDLAQVGSTTAGQGPAIRRALRSLDGTLNTVGDESGALRAGLRDLPGALADARRTADRTATLTARAARTARTLRPAIRRLPTLSADAKDVFGTAGPVLRREVRPLVRQATPLARDARPPVARLRALTPPTRRTLDALAYGFNELVADPGDGRKGFLYWGSWFFHNANSMVSTGDAVGSAWRLLAMVDCGSLNSDEALSSIVSPLLGPLTGGCRP
ncbi:MCE family protein [Patulibacter sp. NPDC049589]|uniref:MCE family protein n=1 Tax=Patulibacter sp. NPDC049589 TaxID=3154731 RepID=UPI0034172450